MIFLLTRNSSFVDRDFIILRSRLLTEPRILVREYGTIPVDPSDDAGDEGGISDWVSLNKQATDPKSHTLVRNSYTRFSVLPLPAKFRW
jgi:hypothetical protein